MSATARAAALVCALALLAGCTSVASGDATRPGLATVERVVDGDTIHVRIGGRTETVRLLGIDTPETVDPRKPVQCFGKEASDRTKALLPHGTEVRLERDAEARDVYGRLLAYVHRTDGTFVNLALLEEGDARPLTISPNVAFAGQFAAASSAARAAGRGLWSACPGEVGR